MANFSLLAKLGVDTKGFQSGLKNAKGQVDSFASSAGKKLAYLAGAAGFGAISRSAIENAKEIKNLANLTNMSVEEFQRGAFAAKQMGISQEKFADILKDVSDKVGDFLQTGGGPMADFFENIAPMVGVTADQFRNLSGKDALQLYVSSLEKANLSQNDMTFYMEAIASDATLLLPLLKENGKEIENLGSKLRTFLTDKEINELAEYQQLFDTWSGQLLIIAGKILTKIVPAFMILKEALGFVGEVFAVNILNAKAFFTLLISNVKTAIGPVIKQFEALSFAVKAAFAMDPKESAAYIKAAAQKSKEGMQDLINAPKEIANNFKTAAKDVAFNIGSLKGDFSKRAGEIKSQWSAMLGGIEGAAKKVKNSFGGGNNAKRDLEALKKKTLEIERDLARAQAEGDRAREQSLQRQLEVAKKVAELMGMGFEAGEAADLAKSLASTKGDFVKDLKPKDLVKAANEAAKEDGRRFQRLADGTFQEFINGSKGKIVTEEQLKKAVEAKIESKPTEKLLEQIKMVLEGKFVNE